MSKSTNILLLLGICGLILSSCLNKEVNNSKATASDSILKIIPFRSGNLWGFANPDGTIIIEPKYETAYLMNDGYGRILLNGMTGLVSPSGEILAEPKYDYIGNFQSGRASVSIGEKLQGYLDENGQEVIPPKFDQVYDFQGNRAIVVKDKKHFLIRKDGSDVKMLPNIIPYSQEPFSDLNENLYNYDEHFLLVQEDKNYKVGVIDSSGNFLINTSYNQLSRPVNNVIVANKGEKFGLLKTDGSAISAMDFQYIQRITEHKFIAQKADLYGVIDEKGNTLLPFNYTTLDVGPESFLIASTESGTGMIDSVGNVIIPFIHTGLFADLGYIITYKENGKSGIIDVNNNQILAPEYDVITILNNDRFMVVKDGKKGVLDKTGKEIVAMTYDGNDSGMEGEDVVWSKSFEKTVVMLTQKHVGTLFSASGKKISDQKWLYCGFADKFGLSIATDLNGNDSYIGPDGRIFSEDPETQKVSVNNAQALFDAIANNTEITLEPGDYDLSALQGESEFAKVNLINNQKSLIISKVKNLHIIGAGPEVTHLFTSSPYVPVIRIEFAHNVTLKGFRIGHAVEKGICEGSVIQTEEVVFVQIQDCDLYGSGTRGLESKYSSKVILENSVIRECTYGILTLDNSFDCGFYSCQMYDNQQYDMVELLNTSQIIFEKVIFKNNHSDKSSGPYSFFKTSSEYDRFTLTDCTFENCSSDYFLNFKYALEQVPDFGQGFISSKSAFQFETEVE